MMKFEILNEAEKNSFSSALDWHKHYRHLRCVEHSKGAKLNLLVDRSGLSVSVNACCADFFREIVELKRKYCRFGAEQILELK